MKRLIVLLLLLFSLTTGCTVDQVKAWFAVHNLPVTEEQAQTIAAHTSDIKSYSRSILIGYGWGDEQWPCLDKLFTKESGWKWNAANPSGAYGIPQALPGHKMATEGSDWKSNPRTQVRWGLGYIKNRYSHPCGAWSHSVATGWY